MRSFQLAITGLGVLLGSVGGAAMAASPAITDAIAKRQANYKEIGKAFKGINDEFKSGSPNVNTVRPLAKNLAARSAMTLKYFPAGSGPQSGIKTRAKPEIWANQAEFVGIQRKMIASADQLNAAAAAGNMAGMSAARNDLGNACKACHDRFRVPE